MLTVENYGISGSTINYNLSVEELYKSTIQKNQGKRTCRKEHIFQILF